MNRRRRMPLYWLLSVCVALFCFGDINASFAQDGPNNDAIDRNWAASAALQLELNDAFVPGELLVGYYADLVGIASLHASLGIQTVETLDLRGLDRGVGEDGVVGYRLSVPPGEEWLIMETLQQDPAVAFVHPNWLVYAANIATTTAVAEPETAFVVNDPSYVDKQWHLPRINASRAWALAYNANGFNGDFSTIRVAVIDSGVDSSHPDLETILLDGYNYVPLDAPMIDDCGHGTHVAGLIGALTNNSIGVAGVAPAIEIDARRVLRQSGGVCSGTLSDVSQAIRDAADAGADIINLSLEVYLPPGSLTTMEAAVNYAASKGVLLIAAAGNRGASAGVAYPGAFDAVMAIASTTYEDVRASYSGTGPQVEIAAPGGVTARSIYSTWSRIRTCRDANTENGYCTSEGTSMAAAIVSGAAALVWSLDHDLSSEQVRQILRETATTITGTSLEVGSGRLDVRGAVRRTLPSTIQLSDDQIEYRARTSIPSTVTVRIENPSLVPIEWEASVDESADWVVFSGNAAGTSSFGAPGHVTFLFDPSGLSNGLYTTNLQVIGRRSDDSTSVKQTVLRLVVNNLSDRWFLPLYLSGASSQSTPNVPYRWETPATPGARQGVGMTDESAVAITLPFTFTLQGVPYTTAQISANGYVSFPDNANLPQGSPNSCLPNRDAVGQSIYGWWSDLNPGAPGAQVSTFQPGTADAGDRFVIEFVDVPTGATVAMSYTVSFQIVLYQNGNIGLNYAQTPEQQNQPPAVTIGVEARDGLFYNQVVCKDAATELGYPPVAPQSIIINATGGLY